jgi:hypothetical protein
MEGERFVNSVMKVYIPEKWSTYRLVKEDLRIRIRSCVTFGTEEVTGMKKTAQLEASKLVHFTK